MMIANLSVHQAFWLRSSVVSVLFSLISEIVLRNKTLIILIFGSSWLNPSVLAQWVSGTVSGALHCCPVMQTPFHHCLDSHQALGEGLVASNVMVTPTKLQSCKACNNDGK